MRSSILLVLALLGCAAPTTEMKPGADAPANPNDVRVTTLEPPSECARIGPVSWTGMPATRERAYKSLQRNAADRGANWVALDSANLTGLGFFCSKEVLAAYDAARRVTPASTAVVCAPDCSPGYTCLNGQCVEACNPKCVSPERCGADRSCH